MTGLPTWRRTIKEPALSPFHLPSAMRPHAIFYIITALCVSTVLASANVSSNDVAGVKNIVFGVTFGGSSHVNWVLAVMDELASRGHNITFATRADFLHFGKPFEQINTIQIANHYVADYEVVMDWSQWRRAEVSARVMDTRISVYAEEFHNLKAFFGAVKADVVVCDYGTESCADAAKSLGLPFIITMSLASSPDARVQPYLEKTIYTLKEPTTLTMPFALRFYNHFIEPYRTKAAFRRPLQKFKEVREQVGAPPRSLDPWKDSLKLVNTAFGFEPARPLGPLVEMVGPIVQRKHAQMIPQIKQYLDSHRRIVFVAFGQNFTPTKEGVEMILGALLDNFSRGIIDAFLWATVHANMHNISKSIALPSGGRHDISDILAGENPHCRLADWVPQQAILQHPSVSAYLTHGGKGSLYESLLNGVRVVVYPMMSDQPFNARTVVHAGLGGSFDPRSSSSQQASEALEMIVRDVSGEIQRNVERYGNLVRIRSAHGAAKGADLVEEVMYMHRGGLLPHRYEASRQMSFLKATNLDLYLALVLSVVVMAYGGWWGLAKMWKGKCHGSTSKRKIL